MCVCVCVHVIECDRVAADAGGGGSQVKNICLCVSLIQLARWLAHRAGDKLRELYRIFSTEKLEAAVAVQHKN